MDPSGEMKDEFKEETDDELVVVKEHLCPSSPIAIKQEPPEPFLLPEVKEFLGMDEINEPEVLLRPIPHQIIKTDSKKTKILHKNPKKNRKIKIRRKLRGSYKKSAEKVQEKRADIWENNVNINLSVKSLCIASDNLLFPKYLCKKCENSVFFPNLADFLCHTLKIHGSSLQFKCTVCSSSFEDTKEMAMHFKTHKNNGIRIVDGGMEDETDTKTFDNEPPWESWDEPNSDAEANDAKESDEEAGAEYDRFRYFNEDFKIKITKSGHKKRFHCEQRTCDQEFSSAFNCCMHIRNQHRLYLCEVCGKEKEGYKNYSSHKNKTHFSVPCPGCPDLVFLKMKEFRDHSITVHNGRYMKCRCDLIVDKYDMRQHNEMFHAPKKFQCSQCNYGVSNSKQALETHILTVHLGVEREERTYLCSHCAAIFDDLSKYNMHVLHKHGTKCEKCNKMCGKGYEKHLAKCRGVSEAKRERPRDKRGKRMRGPKRKFELADDLSNQCEKCKTVFASMEMVEKHHEHFKGNCEAFCQHCSRQFINRRAYLCHKRLTCPITKKSFACPICHVEFARSVSLKGHIDKHNDSPKYRCDTCRRPFFDKNSFKVHVPKCIARSQNPMKPKPAEKTFKCTHCPVVFDQKLILHQHFANEHPGRNLLDCYICGKSFRNTKKLLDHVNVHTGEKPYKCPYCPKTFAQESSVFLHGRTHGKNIPLYPKKLSNPRKERVKKPPKVMQNTYFVPPLAPREFAFNVPTHVQLGN